MTRGGKGKALVARVLRSLVFNNPWCRFARVLDLGGVDIILGWLRFLIRMEKSKRKEVMLVGYKIFTLPITGWRSKRTLETSEKQCFDILGTLSTTSYLISQSSFASSKSAKQLHKNLVRIGYATAAFQKRNGRSSTKTLKTYRLTPGRAACRSQKPEQNTAKN